MNIWFLTAFLMTSVCTSNAKKSSESSESQESTEEPPDKFLALYRVKEKPGETLKDILKTVEYVGHKLDIQNPLQDIVYAYRSLVPYALVPKPIVMRMVNFTRLDAWAHSYRVKFLWKEPWDMMVGLSPDPGCLKRETENWAEKMKYRKVWLKNENVLYQKKNDSKVYKVEDFDHLHHLHNRTIQHKIEITVSPLEESSAKHKS